MTCLYYVFQEHKGAVLIGAPTASGAAAIFLTKALTQAMQLLTMREDQASIAAGRLASVPETQTVFSILLGDYHVPPVQLAIMVMQHLCEVMVDSPSLSADSASESSRPLDSALLPECCLAASCSGSCPSSSLPCPCSSEDESAPPAVRAGVAKTARRLLRC